MNIIILIRQVFIQSSSTVDLREMSKLHDTMIQKLESCPEPEISSRHQDMTEVLADLENREEKEKLEVKDKEENQIK